MWRFAKLVTLAIYVAVVSTRTHCAGGERSDGNGAVSLPRASRRCASPRAPPCGSKRQLIRDDVHNERQGSAGRRYVVPARAVPIGLYRIRPAPISSADFGRRRASGGTSVCRRDPVRCLA